MAETCPQFKYRRDVGEASFESERPYCMVTSEFVQAMRADICNARYDLSPRTDCEIFRGHEGE